MEVKRAEPRDSKSQAPGQPGASQWGSRVVPNAANGWAGQPPPTWQQGYGPQGKGVCLPTSPRSFLQLWHQGGPGGIREPELWSVVTRGQVGLFPQLPPGTRGAGAVPSGEVRGHAQQPALPPGRALRLEWMWAGQAVFRASLGCSSGARRKYEPCLVGPLGLFQLPWLCACHVAWVDLLQTTWDGQEPPCPLET